MICSAFDLASSQKVPAVRIFPGALCDFSYFGYIMPVVFQDYKHDQFVGEGCE